MNSREDLLAKIKPFETAFIIIIALVCGFMLLKIITRPEQSGKSEQLPEETTRVKSFNADSVHRAAFAEAEAKYQSQITALQRDLTAATSKDKVATGKAQQSAQDYAKTPTLANCDKALADCKEENGTKAGVITVLTQQLVVVQDKRKGDSVEINRLVLRSDTLNDGWADANKSNAVLTQSLSKEKRKRFGIGFSAGYGMSDKGLSPVVSVSLSYNLFKF